MGVPYRLHGAAPHIARLADVPAQSSVGIVVEPRGLDLQHVDALFIDFFRVDSQHALFRAENRLFRLRVIGTLADATDCVDSLEPVLVDAITSILNGTSDVAVLIVHPAATTGTAWLCLFRSLNPQEWNCAAVKIVRPATPNTTYALANTGEQPEAIRQSHRDLMAIAREVFSAVDHQGQRVLLRAKIAQGERWFIRYPLGLFAKLRLDGFADYFACQWIVTDRTITAVAEAHASLESDMADTRDLFRHTHIVVNTYSAHNASADRSALDESLALLAEVLEAFSNVRFSDCSRGLKWTRNPSVETLYGILRSGETRFFFADFEAASSTWEVGDEWEAATRPEGEIEHAANRRVDLSSLQGQLGHVRLMRVFHCNSLYDPYRPWVDPVGAGTIAQLLTDTGAWFVDASVTAEPVVDFVATVLDFLMRRADLRAILMGKELDGQLDSKRLLARVNSVLAFRGFAEIS